MSYPRNAASPPIVAVGAIYLLADGTIQTTGASVRVKTGTGSWGSGAGTLACDSTSGIWTYAPTQGETNAESFIVGVYKSASTSAQVTVATSASATAGYSGVDWGKVTAATTTVNLSGTTISTTQQVASVSGAVGSVTGAVTVGTNNDKTGYSLTVTPPTAAAIAAAVWDEILTGATHNIQNSAGKRLRTLASQVVHSGTAQGPGTGNNQIQLDTGASATNGIYDPSVIYIESGTGAGQVRLITQYVGSTRTATVNRDWRINPASDSVFVIQAFPGFNTTNEGLARGGSATTIQLNTSANTDDDCYNGQIVYITSGTGQDQVAMIEDYVGATQTATIRTRRTSGQWAVIPDSTSNYFMLPALVWKISEIQSGLATSTAQTTAQSDLDDIQSRLPAALVGGRMDASVGVMQADTVTAAALAASAVTEIQAGLATSAAVAAVQSDVTTLLGRITATLFSGITYLSRWLGALAGKTADSATQTEIRATTAGATYTITTDSLEAIRDNSGGGGGSGDASQTTLLEVQGTVNGIAASLSGTTVSVSSRVSAAGEITLWAGDDCRVRSGTQIDVTITDVGGAIYTRLSGIGLANLAWGAARIVQPAGAITGTIAALTQAGSGASQTLRISIEITDGGSDLRAADDYTWQIVSSEQHGTEYDQQVELEGSLVLRRRVAVPVY